MMVHVTSVFGFKNKREPKADIYLGLCSPFSSRFGFKVTFTEIDLIEQFTIYHYCNYYYT